MSIHFPVGIERHSDMMLGPGRDLMPELFPVMIENVPACTLYDITDMVAALAELLWGMRVRPSSECGECAPGRMPGRKIGFRAKAQKMVLKMKIQQIFLLSGCAFSLCVIINFNYHA